DAPHQKASCSTISSARAGGVGGTVRPSIRAVLRLITSSYLFGRCTGRSLGLTLPTGRLVHSLVDGGQPRAVIGDVDCEQACRLGRARVLADEMLAAGRLEEAVPRPVHLGRTGRAVLRAERPRQHIAP